MARDLLGGKAYLFNEQFVVKGAKKGASLAWHQDGVYIGFGHSAYLTVWIALDDATKANCCIYILPRNLKNEPGLDLHEWIEDRSELNGYFGDETGIPGDCSVGSIVGFSSITLHRSGSNTTDKSNRLVFEIFF